LVIDADPLKKKLCRGYKYIRSQKGHQLSKFLNFD